MSDVASFTLGRLADALGASGRGGATPVATGAPEHLAGVSALEKRGLEERRA